MPNQIDGNGYNKKTMGVIVTRDPDGNEINNCRRKKCYNENRKKENPKAISPVEGAFVEVNDGIHERY